MLNLPFTQILGLALALLLLWAAIVDLRTRTIPDWVSIAIAAMAPLFWWGAGVDFYPGVIERLCGAYLVFVLFFGMFWLGGMGGGDVKLGTAVAMWFAPMATLTFVVFTSIAGGLITIIAWFHHHKIRQAEGKTEVPYGVAIALGGIWLLAQRFLNHFA